MFTEEGLCPKPLSPTWTICTSGQHSSIFPSSPLTTASLQKLPSPELWRKYSIAMSGCSTTSKHAGQRGRRLFSQVIFEDLSLLGLFHLILGDSAGGNLVASLTLKTITNCIRIPDSLVLSYSALLLQFYPSPSRLLTLIDPLLMAPFMIKCLNAYKDPNYLKSLPRSLKDELELASSEDNIFMSPLLAKKNLLQQFPKTLFIETDMDACLDENIKFSTNLIDAGVGVEVLSGAIRDLEEQGAYALCQVAFWPLGQRTAEQVEYFGT